MRITVPQLLEMIELLPDGKNLPHGATHTVNMADPTGEVPRNFYTGETHMTFTWTTGLCEWTFELPGKG